MGAPSLSIVVAAFNEEGNIEAVAHTVLGVLKEKYSNYELIIVDDSSTDATGVLIDRLAAADPHVVNLHNERNQGMGNSLWRGMQIAKMQYVGSFPGDNAMDRDGFSQLCDLVGQADIVNYWIANPKFRAWQRRVVSDSFVAMMNLLFGLHVRYYNSHAIYRADLLRDLPILSKRHSFLAEILVRLLKSGHSLKQIPATQYDRTKGQTKAFHIKTILSVFGAVVRLFWNVQVLGR